MSPKAFGLRSLTHVCAKLSRGNTDIVASIPQNRAHPISIKKEEVNAKERKYCVTE